MTPDRLPLLSGVPWAALGSQPCHIRRVARTTRPGHLRKRPWVLFAGRVCSLSGLARNFGDAFGAGSGSERAVGVIVGGDALEWRVQIVLGGLPFRLVWRFVRSAAGSRAGGARHRGGSGSRGAKRLYAGRRKSRSPLD